MTLLDEDATLAVTSWVMRQAKLSAEADVSARAIQFDDS